MHGLWRQATLGSHSGRLVLGTFSMKREGKTQQMDRINACLYVPSSLIHAKASYVVGAGPNEKSA
jgi:hypothetical protein